MAMTDDTASHDLHWKTRQMETAAMLAVARCRRDLEWDLIPYYEGQRDAYRAVLGELEPESLIIGPSSANSRRDGAAP